jgi:hypothetical protein
VANTAARRAGVQQRFRSVRGENKMRENDSSLTRVKPIFDALHARDPAGGEWLDLLLALPTCSARPKPAPHLVSGPLSSVGWGANEKALPPPPVLLQWLIACGRPRPGRPSEGSEETLKKRALLTQRDPATIGEALALLNRRPIPAREWYVLEGPSKPDVYLETSDTIIVIEGKRTEPAPTRMTDWMETRDQMLRHLDCAHASSDGKSVLGFMIVEGAGGATDTAVPKIWDEEASATVSLSRVRQFSPPAVIQISPPG